MTIDDQASCEAILQTWFDDSCVLQGATTFDYSSEFDFFAPVIIFDTVHVQGVVQFFDGVNVSGASAVLVVDPGGFVVIGYPSIIDQAGYIINKGTLENTEVLAYGTGSISVEQGSAFGNWGGLFENDCFGTQPAFCDASVNIANGGSFYNGIDGVVEQAGQFVVSCGARFSNLGLFDGPVTLQTGPNCFYGPGGTPPGDEPAAHRSPRGSTVVNGAAVNSGTMTEGCGDRIVTSYNSTFSNSGTIGLAPGCPGGFGFAGYPPASLSVGGHPVIDTGTIVDGGNVTGNVSGSGTVVLPCAGTVYLDSGSASRAADCHPTSLGIAPAPTYVATNGRIGIRAVVTDLGSSPAPPTGTVTWSDGGAAGVWPAGGGVCVLRPMNTTSSACSVIYAAGKPNASVQLNASYAASTPLLGGLAQSVDQASYAQSRLVVGVPTSVVLATKSTCTGVGGAWNATTSSCTVSSLTVAPNASLTIAGHTTLRVLGSLNISGSLGVWGNLTVVGSVDTTGSVVSNGSLWIPTGGRWSNDGLLQLATSPLTNDGTFADEGVLYDLPPVCGYCPVQHGNVTNRGLLEVGAGGTLVDTAWSFLTPYGAVNDTAGGSIVVNGSWTVGATTTNRGTVLESATGALAGSGLFDNFANLTIQGTLSAAGGILRNERGGLVTNAGLVDALELQNLAGGTISNVANGTFELNLTSSNAGTIRNGAGGTLEVGYVGMFTNGRGALLRNSASGLVDVYGTLLDAGSVANAVGGSVENGGQLTVTPSGTIANAGVFDDSAPLSLFVATLPRPGVATVSGNLSGSGAVNDTVGFVDEGCGGVVHAAIAGHAAESSCGDHTSTALAPPVVSGLVNHTATVIATVTDTSRKNASTPTGNVTFDDGPDASAPAFASCTLARLNVTSSRCSVTFTPAGGVLGNLAAVYLGDAGHRTSFGSGAIAIGERLTSTTVTTSKGTVRVGANITVRATVSDASPGTPVAPTGIVAWSDEGSGGAFPLATCALKIVNTTSSSCGVTYTAPYLNANDSVFASYGGDPAHRGSSGNASIGVGTPCTCHTWQSPAPEFGGNFGWAVAVSGARTVVGALNENSSAGAHSGIAYVRNTTTGAPISTLVSPNATYYGEFGYAVAISGTLAVVGAPLEGSGQGHAYLYNATTGALLRSWSSPAAGAVGYFGESVAIAGATVVVGAPFEPVPRNGTNVSQAGQAYVFSGRSGKLLRTLADPKPVVGDYFGYAVAVNGTEALVGQPQTGAYNPPYGPGHAFLVNVTSGKLLAKLSSSHPRSGGQFGAAVALDAAIAAVGAPTENAGTWTSAGRAYTFSASGGGLLGILPSPHPAFRGLFGTAVAVDGNAVVVGAPGETVYGHIAAGNAYAFAANGTLVGSFVGPGVAYARFGSAAAADGARSVVAAVDLPVGSLASAGRVYVF